MNNLQDLFGVTYVGAEIKRAFLELIDENQPIDPYELRRIFTEAIREWEMKKGWDEASRGPMDGR